MSVYYSWFYENGLPPRTLSGVTTFLNNTSHNFFSGEYFQYINVPGPKDFEWGYNRGAPEHNREQYFSQKGHTFKSKLKTFDSYGGNQEKDL